MRLKAHKRWETVHARLVPDQVLPLHYTRQQIQQVFDISKNYADILPIRGYSEQTFHGHLFILFVATIIRHQLQKL
jgi:transposase